MTGCWGWLKFGSCQNGGGGAPVALQKAFVLGVGDLSGGQEESVDPDAMDGAFAVLAGVGAHQEPGGGDRTSVGSIALPDRSVSD